MSKRRAGKGGARPLSGRTGGKAKSIDEYLTALDDERRAPLDALRRTIRSIVPRAEECISYGLPAFRLDGTVLAGFAATADGYSYYPFSSATLQTLSGELSGYATTKGALKVGAAERLPVALVRKLLKTRIAEG